MAYLNPFFHLIPNLAMAYSFDLPNHSTRVNKRINTKIGIAFLLPGKSGDENKDLEKIVPI